MHTLLFSSLDGATARSCCSHLDRGVGAKESLERLSRGNGSDACLGDEAVVEED